MPRDIFHHYYHHHRRRRRRHHQSNNRMCSQGRQATNNRPLSLHIPRPKEGEIFIHPQRVVHMYTRWIPPLSNANCRPLFCNFKTHFGHGHIASVLVVNFCLGSLPLRDHCNDYIHSYVAQPTSFCQIVVDITRRFVHS